MFHRTTEAREVAAAESGVAARQKFVHRLKRFSDLERLNLELAKT
jgi:hypothetical protein